jgi:hypothetical protein
MKNILTDDEFNKLEDAPDFLTDEDFNNLPDEDASIRTEQYQIPETGFVEAGLRGAAQGLTFDTADEIAALAESTFGNKSYDQALKESRAEYKLAEEEYPVASFLGGVAGGIGQAAAVTAATGGIGALAGAEKLKKIADAARALYLPTTGQSALKNIATAAKTGAVMSGLTSIGASEKQGLERLKEVPSAVVSGAVIGGALGGAGEGIIKGADKLSSMADAGDLPFSFQKVRDIYRSGKEGQGYITRKSLEDVDKKFMNAADESVNLIQTSLDDLRNIKKEIVKNVANKVPAVNASLQDLKKQLEDQVVNNLADAEPALKGINRIVSNLQVDETGSASPEVVNNIINQLDDYIFSAKDLSSDVKSVFRNTANELKLRLRSSISPQDAFESVQMSPEFSDLYKRYLGSFGEEELANSKILAKQEQDEIAAWLKQMKTAATKNKNKLSPEMQKKAQTEFNRAIGSLKRTKDKTIDDVISKLENKEDIQAILAAANEALEEKAKINPLGQLDAMMHNILNASEDLGKVTRGQGTDLQRKFKIFDIMRGSSSDTGTGQKAVEKYKSATENLYKANKNLGKKFEEITKPRILEMENKKFLQGAKLGEESKEGVLQSIITGPAKLAGLGANVTAQIGNKMQSPIVSGMLRAKNIIDSEISKSSAPNSLLQFFSTALQNAVETKSDTRRAAILNTLNQYEYFRNIFKSAQE